MDEEEEGVSKSFCDIDVSIDLEYAYLTTERYLLNEHGQQYRQIASRLSVFDLQNREEPQLLGYCDIPPTNCTVKDWGNIVLLADSEYDLRVIDTTDPTEMQEISSYDKGNPHDVVMSGRNVFVANGSRGLQISQLDRRGQPVETGSLDLGRNAERIFYFEPNAYVVDDDKCVHIIDVSDISNPVLTGTYHSEIEVGNLEVRGNLLLIRGGSVFEVIDITDLANPVVVYHRRFFQSWKYVTYNGDFAYVSVWGAGDEGGLLVLNVSDPTAPDSLYFLNCNDLYESVIYGDYLYAYYRTPGYIFDISNPAQPRQCGEFECEGQMVIEGNRMVTTSTTRDFSDRLVIYDLTTPTEPRLVAFHDQSIHSGNRLRFDLGEPFLVTVSGYSLAVYDYREILGVSEKPSLPLSSALLTSFPNPCNGQTMIHFTLPTASLAELQVLDLTGRQVAEVFATQSLPRGDHQFNADLNGLPTGEYLLKLKTGETTLSQKLILLK